MKHLVNSQWRVAFVALILATSASAISACAPFTARPQACACGPGPQVFFSAQPDQLAASGDAGAFVVETFDITRQQFWFYYVFRATKPTNLRVAASDEPQAASSAPGQLATTNQVLGQIGAYTVGVVHVARGRDIAKTVTLTLSPTTVSGTPAGPSWRLAPLKQLIPDQQGVWYSSNGTINPGPLPEVTWSGEVTSQHVSYVRIITPREPHTYVFLRSDDPVAVTVITKAQYLAIAGSANFTP